ncbi:MAG: hypothetical protein HOF23_03215 [Rhodospirillaceae bacterium]|nr:hypothetical protein [Rhodospirillaceae bacterium]
MVDNPRYSDQEDFEFVQNLFDQLEPEQATAELKADILRAAPTANLGKSTRGFGFGSKFKSDLDELIDYLWPFGALWRPATGLVAAAMFGIMFGVTDPLSTNGTQDADEALTEEIVAYSAEAEGQLEDL